MPPDTHDFEAVIRFLRSLRATGYWGTTELRFRGQEITVVEQHTTYKPGELPS